MEYEFEVDGPTANNILTEWMHSFDERHPQKEV